MKCYLSTMLQRQYTNEVQITMDGRIFSKWTVANSIAVIAAILALRLATPATTTFLRQVYDAVSARLTPPFLYLIINGIIISIAATSRYQKPAVHPPPTPTVAIPALSEVDDDGGLTGFVGSSIEIADLPVATAAPVEEDFADPRSSMPLIRSESEDLTEEFDEKCAVPEKPLFSARLGRRRSIKAISDGKALGVARPRKNETLENTWRTITDGRPMPLSRHHRKTDTSASHTRAVVWDPTLPPSTGIPSCQALVPRSPNGARSSSPSFVAGGGLRRESSAGQEDLNRRVEGFIKKFNEEMRLQRQKSLQQYMDMINRGSY